MRVEVGYDKELMEVVKMVEGYCEEDGKEDSRKICWLSLNNMFQNMDTRMIGCV